MPRSPSPASRLAEWLRGVHGVDLEAAGLELRESPDRGLGVFALRRLPPGSSLGRVPAAAVLHAGSASSSGFGRRVLAALGAASGAPGAPIEPEEMLWLYMVWGLDEPEACPWWPYLRSLPVEDPLGWRRDRVARRRLRGTPLGRMAELEDAAQRRRHSEVLGLLREADPALFSPERFPLERWLWAQSCYVSRSFDGQAFPRSYRENGWESDVLCPLLDVLNHTGSARVKYNFTEASVGLSLPEDAGAPYEAGDEVFNNYGATLGNDKLLARYGFVIQPNPHDVVSEVVFEPGPGEVASRLAPLMDADDLCLDAELAHEGAVRVKPMDGLRSGYETPAELLRAAAQLERGLEYVEEEAGAAEKRDASAALGAALRRMLRREASLRVGSLLRARRARREGARRAQPVRRARRAGGPKARVEVPVKSGGGAGAAAYRSAAERSAHVYASGWRQILRDAAERAEMHAAEMAELARRMDMGELSEVEEVSGR